MSEPLANAKNETRNFPFFPETQTFNHAFKRRPTVYIIIYIYKIIIYNYIYIYIYICAGFMQVMRLRKAKKER